MRWGVGVVGLVVLWGGLLRLSGQELRGVEGVELLRQEALPRWREYQRLTERWVGSAVLEEDIQRGDGKRIKGRSRYVVRQSEAGGVYEHYLEHYEPRGPVRGDYVYGVNSRYAFWLEKGVMEEFEPQTQKRWQLRSLDLGGDGKVFFQGEHPTTVWDMVRGIKLTGLNVVGKNLPELLEYEPFRVVRMREVVEGGRGLWEVEFECPHAVDRPPYYAAQGGVMRLDAGAYWTLVWGRFRTQDIIATGVCEISIEYKVDNGVPIPVRRREVGSRSNGTKSRYEVTYDFFVPSRGLDEQEFTLSSYGLPEPVGVEWEKKTPVYVWLLLAAGVLGLLAVVLAWLAKRRRATG